MKGLQYFPFERNHYYYGKFLSADVLDAEQTYMNNKRRFVNRFLFGSGVVFGMSVLAVDDRTVAVQPGAALDFAGREIVIDQPFLLALNTLEGSSQFTKASVLYLCLSYDEYPLRKEDRNDEYDTVSEHYRFSLMETLPQCAETMTDRFLKRTETVYSCESFSVTQEIPAMVSAGGETVLTVTVRRLVRDTAVNFSYQVRLTGMKCGDDSLLTVSYDSQEQPMTDDCAVLYFPLHVLLHADGEEGTVETVSGTFVSSSDRRSEGYSIVRMSTEVVVGSLKERMLGKFRDEGMQLITQENVYQPPICLAAIHLCEKNGSVAISEVKRMPFSQYLNTGQTQALEIMAGGGGTHETHSDTTVTREDNPAERLMQKYAVSSGIAEIAMPMGGRAGQRFFSEPISHGLGVGRTAVTLGVIKSEQETIYGSTEVFAEDSQDICAELAAKLDTEQGSFTIGVKLKEPTSAVSVRIHWTAVRSHMSEVMELHPHLVIKPDIASLNVMENLTFEVQFEQCPKQAVKWSIAEGARGGVITDGGAYTAPNTPGVYQIQVRSVESGLQASAFVSVRDLHHSH